MNCAEYRDHLIACAEGLLDRETELQCRAHLAACADCHAEYEAIMRLQTRLLARGHAAAGVKMVEPVMRRVRRELFKPERETIMSKLLKHRWGFGLGAAAAAAAILSGILLTFPSVQARAEEVMAKGAQAVANLTSIHLRGQLRTYPGDNFGSISADSPFCTIEMWKQFGADFKWRVEKPQRVVVMDGKTTVMLMGHIAVKIPQRTTSAYDTDWLQRIANLSSTISNELSNARAKGWKLTVADETSADGHAESVVTILAKSKLPDNDYGKNGFMDNADTRRIYHFDAQSKRLESVQIYLERPSGEVQIFELSQIDYNQPIDASKWQLDLPADVSWVEPPKKLADNGKYAAMKQGVDACNLLPAIMVDAAFWSPDHSMQLVKCRAIPEKKWNIAVRKDNPAGRWQVDGGL